MGTTVAPRLFKKATTCSLLSLIRGAASLNHSGKTPTRTSLRSWMSENLFGKYKIRFYYFSNNLMFWEVIATIKFANTSSGGRIEDKEQCKKRTRTCPGAEQAVRGHHHRITGCRTNRLCSQQSPRRPGQHLERRQRGVRLCKGSITFGTLKNNCKINKHHVSIKLKNSNTHKLLNHV